MSKGLRIVGTVAGVVALAAGTIATGGGLGIMAVATAKSIASYASIAAAVAGLGAQLTAKKPSISAVGSANQILIGNNMPQPYLMGRSYSGGVIVHNEGYGPEVDDVKNPYQSWVYIYSGGGPVHEFEAFQADFKTITFAGDYEATGYYDNFMFKAHQLGACPEPSALPSFVNADLPNWGAAYKLSGYCAAHLRIRFDKDGKVYASGVPQFGAIIKGVLAYDPRLDTTYPGGSGACRALEEDTYVWSENPAIHATTYALGRWQGSGTAKKVMGCGFAVDAIDWPAFVAWANVCDANGWKVGGTVYEPGSRWDNLKRICAAGAAEPVWSGGKLSVRYSAPKVALDTIGRNDIAEGEQIIPGMKTWRDRKNGYIPRYRSEEHRWEYVQSALVTVADYVTSDRGEEKHEELQFELVQHKDQAARLAAYALVNARELEPIVLPLKPRFIEYRINDALEIGADLSEETGLPAGQVVVIVGRVVDPATGIVTLTLVTETAAKHAFALGQTGTAPPVPELTDPEDLDDVVSGNRLTKAEKQNIIRNSYSKGLTVTGQDNAGDGEIVISDHTRDYPGSTADVAITGTTLTGLTLGAKYYLYYDDSTLADTAPTFAATTSFAESINSSTNPFRHDLKRVVTIPGSGGTPTTGGSTGGGYGGGGDGGDIP